MQLRMGRGMHYREQCWVSGQTIIFEAQTSTLSEIVTVVHKWNITPLIHGRRKAFFQGEANSENRIFPGVAKNIFPREGKSGEIAFYPLEIKKTTFFC